jgi:ATP-dependent Lon protease
MAENEVIIKIDDLENSDNENESLQKLVQKIFPGVKQSEIESFVDKNVKQYLNSEDSTNDKSDNELKEETKYGNDSDGGGEYDDDDEEIFDSNCLKFNIVLSMNDLPQLEDDYDSYDGETTDDEYDNTELINYEKPITRSNKTVKDQTKNKVSNILEPIELKENILPTLRQNSKITSKEKVNKKKQMNTNVNMECKKDSELVHKMMEARVKGDAEFSKFCNEIIDEKEKEIEMQKKEKEEKETNDKKEINSKIFRRLLKGQQHSSEIKYFNRMKVCDQNDLITKFKHIYDKSKIEVPYKISLINSNIPSAFKVHAIKKINSLECMDQSSGEYYKAKQWIDTFMKIPFGKYTSLPIKLNESKQDDIQSYMEDSIQQLNNIVYGLDDAKFQIIQMIGQWISNPKSIGNAIAIKGPMGTGKTTLVKEGVSKILNRPFAFIALGGATDSSFLEGHSYTYEGSIWGKIVEILINSKCMNPVIYFDELDKISDTPRGEEIVGILTHLTDCSQNDQFHDKYFSGIDFDLSRALFIFSYNDEDKVNSILKDRMYHIETKGYDNKEKNIIANKYMLPKIRDNVLFNPNDIVISDEVLEYINNKLTKKEKGVRNLKRCLEIIHTKINLYRLLKPDTELFNNEKSIKIDFPFNVTTEHVEKFIRLSEGDDIPFNMYT